jgi:hypothetical protein
MGAKISPVRTGKPEKKTISDVLNGKEMVL